MAKNAVITNFEQLAEAIGSYMGMMDGLDGQEYMNGVVAKSHKIVAPAFDKAAVSLAMKDKSMAHMWEYGTAGINEGGGKTKHANPLSPTAKLWHHTITAVGQSNTIGYTFRPAKSFVPRHNPEELGIKEENMPQRLAVDTGKKRYSFSNKAFVYESGMTVNLMAKRTHYLFIPIETEGMPRRWRGKPKLGFVWAKYHKYSPGDMADSTGRFTGFFGSWWATAGSAMLFDNMSREVEMDLVEAATGIRPSKRLTKAQAAKIKSAVQRGRSKTRKQWTIKVRHEMGKRAETIL